MEFHVLECKRLSVPHTAKTVPRTVKDYELDLFIGERRELFVDGAQYEVHEGDICFRKPGQRVYGTGDNHAFLLTLDFSGRGPIANYSRNTAKEIQPLRAQELLDRIPTVLSTTHSEKYKHLFSVLMLQPDCNSTAAKALITEILYRINADIQHLRFKESTPAPTPADQAAQYMQQNFGEEITLETLSKIACLDRSYLVRIFKQRYHETPIRYLIDIRLSNARDLVLETELPISEIAECCGYHNHSFFILQYKKKYGMSPAAHRKYGFKK